jgi:hypothetical protein
MIPTVESLRIKMISNVMNRSICSPMGAWRKAVLALHEFSVSRLTAWSTAARTARRCSLMAAFPLHHSKSAMGVEHTSTDLACVSPDQVQEFMS